MAPRKKSKAKKQRHGGAPARQEDRASLSLTVAWMLTAIVTAGALLVAGVVQAILWQAPPQTDGAQPLRLVPGLFLLVACLTGLLTIVMTPVVYRVRRDPPPRSIAVAALAIGALPIAVIAWRLAAQ